jgi:hypothetical protein
MAEEDFNNAVYFSHLKPLCLEQKKEYYFASQNIQDSFTGLMPLMGLHRIFIEAAYEIRNGIKQFEEGFVGSAFYSVRTAVELARVIAYFATIENPTESQKFVDWNSGAKFPFDRDIKKEIEKTGDAFIQVKDATGDFFDKQTERLRKFQKYIHKQGFRTFYERGFTASEREERRLSQIKRDFVDFVENSLVEIGLLRLCIDPFPVLLNDPAIMRKIHFESMTYPFNDYLMDLIGPEMVAAYRNTDFYEAHLDYFAKNDDLSDEALMLINDNYYSRESWDIIKGQADLLPPHDRIAVFIFNKSNKIAQVYSIGGWHMWFSDIKTARKKHEWSGLTFRENIGINIPYDEAYLSYFKIEDQDYWIEHNEPLSNQDVESIKLLNS